MQWGHGVEILTFRRHDGWSMSPISHPGREAKTSSGWRGISEYGLREQSNKTIWGCELSPCLAYYQVQNCLTYLLWLHTCNSFKHLVPFSPLPALDFIAKMHSLKWRTSVDILILNISDDNGNANMTCVKWGSRIIKCCRNSIPTN